MDKFIMIIFSNEKQAYEGLHELRQLHQEGTVTVFSTSVVEHDADGKLTIKQRADEGPL